MKPVITFLLALLCHNSFAQPKKLQPVKAFATYEEYFINTPSLEFNLQLREISPVDFQGGIGMYVLKNVKPVKDSDKLSLQVWGFVLDNVLYVNTYHYTGIKGYNPVLDNGYYKYLLGKLTPNEKLQKELGIAAPTVKWHQGIEYGVGGYVIFPDGKLKFLSPELLSEICRDNQELSKEIAEAKLTINDREKMFEFLKRYNATK